LGKNISLDLKDIFQIKAFIKEFNIEMVIIGPEQPLVDGLGDQFAADRKLKNIKFIGPGKKGAMLEGSKDFSKAFMLKNNIPTAAYKTFDVDNLHEASAFLETLNPPYVLKADGLAAGKGVLILDSIEEAKAMLNDMIINKKFGKASSKVVIEEFLDGIELSVFVLTDGINYKILPEAKDYKRIGENDTGLNTGGMGSISPVPFADKKFLDKVEKKVIIPTIEGLKKDKIEYNGFIFFGLIKVEDEPYVIEYNVRMGDPEAESVLPRIKSDLLDLFLGVAEKNINEKEINIDDRTVAAVFTVAGGYPEGYEKGKVINGLENISESIVFHAGTKLNSQRQILTNGGRVIAISSYGKNIKEALSKSYQSIDKMEFEGMNYRRDIGNDLS